MYLAFPLSMLSCLLADLHFNIKIKLIRVKISPKYMKGLFSCEQEAQKNVWPESEEEEEERQ